MIHRDLDVSLQFGTAIDSQYIGRRDGNRDTRRRLQRVVSDGEVRTTKSTSERPHSHGHPANYATRPLRPCAKSKPAAKQTNESVAGSGTSPAPARRLSLLIENVEFGCSRKSHSLAQVTLPGPIGPTVSLRIVG